MIEILVADRIATWPAFVTLAGGRVWQLKLPQKPVLPAARVQLIDGPGSHHLRGTNALQRSQVQTDVYAHEAGGAGVDGYTQADLVAHAVDAALDGKRWAAGSPPVRVTGAFRIGRRVLYEADELRLVRILQEYVVWWTA